MGQAYLNGTGVKKDSLWGRYWLEQAAWSGHSQAQFLLAALFKKGLGGQKDIPEAWAWLKRSGQNGNKEAEAVLPKLTLSLTETEKQRGRQLLKKTERVPPGGLYQAAKVRYVQASLNEIGFSAGGEDGEYGPATQRALARYLQKKELPGDSSINRVIRSLRGRD